MKQCPACNCRELYVDDKTATLRCDECDTVIGNLRSKAEARRMQMKLDDDRKKRS